MILAAGIRMSNTHPSGSLCVYFKVYSAWGVANEVLPNPRRLQCNFLSITFYHQYVLLVVGLVSKYQAFLIELVCLLKLKLWVNKC